MEVELRDAEEQDGAQGGPAAYVALERAEHHDGRLGLDVRLSLG